MKFNTKYLLNHPVEGRKKSDALKGTLVLIALATLLVSACLVAKRAQRLLVPQQQPSVAAKVATTTKDVIDAPSANCDRVNDHETICWGDVTISTISVPVVKNTVTAIRTKYSRADSCHYPVKKNGKTICLTAIGKDTKEGQTVACPRNIKLGTKVMIEGKVYTCEDRYAQYLDTKRGMPTFDVFAEAENMHKLPGHKVIEVAILQ